jgi:hypothetical protein
MDALVWTWTSERSYRRRVSRMLAAGDMTTIKVEGVPWAFSPRVSAFFQAEAGLSLAIAETVQQLAWGWGCVHSQKSMLLSPENLSVGSVSLRVVIILIRANAQCGVVVTLADEFPLGPDYYADRLLLNTELNHMADQLDERGGT